MRAGWMRPSSISLTRVSFAVSRRMPSKDERTTACGVSSMMKSTPVRCSEARMLRPSRPMIRPFMSSDGKLDERHRRLRGVDAANALECVGDEVPSTALRLGTRLLLHLAHLAARARAGSDPRSARGRCCFASATVMPERRSSSRTSRCFASFSSAWSAFEASSRSARP